MKKKKNTWTERRNNKKFIILANMCFPESYYLFNEPHFSPAALFSLYMCCSIWCMALNWSRSTEKKHVVCVTNFSLKCWTALYSTIEWVSLDNPNTCSYVQSQILDGMQKEVVQIDPPYHIVHSLRAAMIKKRINIV